MKKIFFYRALSALFVGGMAFSAVSCADDNMGENASGSDQDAVVRFDVSDVQEEAEARGGALTRGAINPGLTDEDLSGRKLETLGSEDLNACLIETTVEGVNPVKLDEGTRGNITTLAKLRDFSSTGLRGTGAGAIGTNWFDEEKTRKDGTLYTKIPWSTQQPYGRFYAVYPESKNNSNGISFTRPVGTAVPSIVFTVNTDVRKQVDLMTACTGEVHYATRNQAPTTSLQFRHALTAIRFAVGQNLSFNKTIKEIKLINVLLKSKYVLSNQLNGSGAAWVPLGGAEQRGTVSLSGLNYNTNENVNSIVRDRDRDRGKYSNENMRDILQIDDDYTFYMIPQQLDGKVTAEINFTDNSKITVPLKGSWQAGTTRTYKLSHKESNWEYEINGASPDAAGFSDSQSSSYGIQSFRHVSGGNKVAVPWEVVGYSEDEGKTWTTNKPAWLKSLSKERGNGSDRFETGNASLVPATLVDLVAERNKELQNATPLGSDGTPYNLSNPTGAAAVQNTANSYLISAPGYYMLPLVYGNAIKDGQTNTSAYKMTVGNNGTALPELKDQEGRVVTDPWIEKNNPNIDLAWIIWSDEKDLVKLPNNGIYRAPDGKLYMKFQVTKENIKSGNAVVAVRKTWQTARRVQELQGRRMVWKTVYDTHHLTLWSWHLWFAPKNALDKISVTNKQGKTYDFTNESLGWKPTVWNGTPYQKPRTVKVKVRQTIGNFSGKKESYITITQLPGASLRKGYTTMYQWGRKDAFPGTTAALPQGSINWTAGDKMTLPNIIQNPNNFYNPGYNRDGSLNAQSVYAQAYAYYNLWSMNNTAAFAENVANSQPVVKTIYDPSPVGFSVPPTDAFTGFTATGVASQNKNEVNADGTIEAQAYKNNFGYNFWTNSNKVETIFFPSSGYREALNGSIMMKYGEFGEYWTATPNDNYNGCVLGFGPNVVHPLYRNTRAFGFSVRPVAETK